MKKGLSIDERIANLKEFSNLWTEFADFVGEVGVKGRSNIQVELEYQEYISKLSMGFPRIQADIERWGLRVNRLVPAGGGLFREVPNYNPFVNVGIEFPSLNEIVRFPRAGPRNFIENWGLGKQIILHAIGTLEFAKEFGDQNLAVGQESSHPSMLEIIASIKKDLRPSFKRHPVDEKEIQDHVELILRVLNVDYTREPYVEHSSKRVRPDFSLDTLQIALELKYCKSDKREREIIEEIGADITAYRQHFTAMYFILYDVGIIADREKFTKDFNSSKDVWVEIIS